MKDQKFKIQNLLQNEVKTESSRGQAVTFPEIFLGFFLNTYEK